MRWWLLYLLILSGWPWTAAAQSIDVAIAYLERVIPAAPTLSNLDPKPDDLARAGAELGVSDVSTTGKFLGFNYSLDVTLVEEGEDFLAAAKDILENTSIVILNAPRSDILALSDMPHAKNALLFNIATKDIVLRESECRANVLHTIPSRAMLADALSQFAVKKRWTDWALITGPKPGDAMFADAVSRSASKFGVTITNRKDWSFDADLRRSAAQEVPLFTQEFDDHDMLIVADELNDFARYIEFNTWLPRPIGGSSGIIPVAWSKAVEQHGAAQLQSRFVELAGRLMQSEDYAAMLAVAAVGEAVTRTKSNTPKVLREYMLSPEFEIGGFKGRPLSFRDWNGQMRQPVPLAHPNAVVALAPLDGFLHQHNELDTLGMDRPNSQCEAFAK